VQALKKSFSTDAGRLDVLRGVDLEIRRGEMVGIVGASGAGKSTLLHILGALDTPSSGRVLYGDTDIFTLDRVALASFRNRQIGFVFQFHHLLPEFSALENAIMPGLIGMGERGHGATGLPFEEIRDRADRLLGEFGLSDRKKHRPGELSGGEQQRLAVARALILEPGVVLADEPTGNLDTNTGEELFRILLNLNQSRGITFVIVTHNESLSGRCHRIVRMEDGILK
jgi:lipoprotein-releasing system ATP-binding protein